MRSVSTHFEQQLATMPTGRRWGDDDFDNSKSSTDAHRVDGTKSASTSAATGATAASSSSSATQTVETEPDANGIKTVVTLATDDRGRRTKIVKKVQVRQVEALVPKAVLKRRNMRKFGAVRRNLSTILSIRFYFCCERKSLSLRFTRRTC
jgi:hypothetical protein